jgi:tetratricopeptide (TPR) repeat protein
MSCRWPEISLLSLFLLLPYSAFAHGTSQNGSTEVDGFVYSANGGQLPANVMVNLCDANGIVIQQSATTGGGRFYFQGLGEAEYVLKISADSYQPQEVHVNLQFGNVHGTIVYLQPLSSGSAKPSSVVGISSHELSMPEPARELLISGRTKLYRENKPQEALDDFLRAQQKAPGFYELNYELGMAYLNLGQKVKAQDCFVKAIAISKDTYGDPQIAFGTLLVDQGNLAEGEKKIQRGIQLNPSLWMGYYQLARLELIRGQLEEAERDAEQSRSLAPKAAINYQLLSIIHLRQKKYPQLLQDIDMYLELDPNSPAAQRARAVRDQVVQEIKKEQALESSPVKK